MYFNYLYLHLDISLKSCEVVVVCAFGSHFLKEVSRSQLCAAAKTLLPKVERSTLHGTEKCNFIKPLAKIFLEKKIVSINKDARIENLTRKDVKKVGTF